VVNFVSLGTPVVNVSVLNSTFADNRCSIHPSGDDGIANATLLRTRFTIEGNTFTGFGPDSDLVNYGIIILTGAGGEVKGNTMTGYSYAGAATGFSSAIHAYDGRFDTRGYVPVRPVRYEGNSFSTNDHHLVIVAANDSTVVSNVFLGTGPGMRRWGGLALSGTNVTIARNDFADMPIGVELFGGDLNGTFLRGVATNPKLHTNRFCRVAEPIHVQPLVTGVQEQGTELCTNVPAPRDHYVPAEYATIQAAVDAAVSGDTIHIAAGDYFEQITIANKGRLNLVGEPGAVLHATTEMKETLRPFNWTGFAVLANYRSEVAISGLTIAGENLGEWFAAPLHGLDFVGAGGVVTNCIVSGFRGASTTSTTVGRGVHCFNPVATGSSAANLTIANSTLTNNQIAIHLRGDPAANPGLLRATAKVQGNTIMGFGSALDWNAGIWIACGVTGEVIGNTISDFAGTGDLHSSGVAAYDAAAGSTHGRFVSLLPIKYERNTFSNNGQHLLIVGGNENQVVNNRFVGTVQNSIAWGAVGLSGTNLVVVNNNFSDMPTGIVLVGDEAWGPPWPIFPPAANPTLTANWFCNVPEPIRVNPALVKGIVEEGTAQCENGPLRPVFQSIRYRGEAGTTLTVRGWHRDSMVVEASTDLLDWLPVHTNTMALPLLEYQDPNEDGAPHRFYRAVRP
jgi:hypothetical protein